MTDLAQPALCPPFTRGKIARTLVILLILATLGDWLCYDQCTGAGTALFACCLGMAAYFSAPTLPTPQQGVNGLLIVVLAQVPWLMEPSLLAFCLSVLGTAIAAARLNGEPSTVLSGARDILLSMMWRIVPDLVRAWGSRKILSKNKVSTLMLGWIVPVVGGVLFLSLFADANPIIADTLSAANPALLLQVITSGQAVFWLFLACLAWPFLAMPTPQQWRTPKVLSVTRTPWMAPFNNTSVTRALILFNGLFALQTGLDMAYLWGGLKLPSGLTYADYAHRGAYPLIVTALLAGGFAILTTRPGTPPASSRLIRLLILSWVAQNLILVGSSIFRLKLYVSAYALTELRLASFIWMLLVFAGLVLIIVRILWSRSDIWLLQSNALSAFVTVYFACCLNFPGIVAQYDVSHCQEITGSGSPLDFGYLQALGPSAIPALDRFKMTLVGRIGAPVEPQDEARTVRITLAQHFTPSTDWRDFSLWHWALQRYLGTHPLNVPGYS